MIDAFKNAKVLSRRELTSRFEIYVEQYIMAIQVEASTVIEMAKTQIYPAVIRYAGELANDLAGLTAVGITVDTSAAAEIAGLSEDLLAAVASLEKELAHEAAKPITEAKHLQAKVVPGMDAVREIADKLEGLVADDYWPLPTYQEMLFIKCTC